MSHIILASKSPFRAALMKKAGLTFESIAAQINERDIEAPLQDSGVTPQDVALILAEAKAHNVALKYPNALVIGSDQTLSLRDRVFHKSANMDEAREHLLSLQCKTHQLNSAVVLVQNNVTIWRHVSIANMTMRALSAAYIGRHLARVGDAALTSVGAYQFENEGIQLFEKIDGDYFTILGLPMIPLLAALRERGFIDG